ncbi:hypothetical protein ACPPVW_04645 [Leifsonia sp. McL0607]|uniref:hypothetical protein n=1 Tax=Leifsonia sp. McL0607 TaxID=3415672 RepID=UPI003CE7AC76
MDTDLWIQPPVDGTTVALPPDAPPDLQVRRQAPRPLRPDQADLGTPLPDGRAAPPPDGSAGARSLVVIGDSITQGFQSLAIHRTQLSWPTMVARALEMDFTYPTFDGPQNVPGLPVNLEALARSVEASIKDRPLPFEDLHVLRTAISSLEDVRHFWEKGDGSVLSGSDTYYDNLAIWGWDIRDAISKSREWCQGKVAAHEALLKRLTVSNQLMVSHANERTALRTLWNAADPEPSRTQVDAMKYLGSRPDGRGIDTLVIALGANNALGSVASMSISWSGDDFQDVDKKSQYNVWTPQHFAIELELLADEVLNAKANRTLWLTVPHVTVVPLLRGVGEKPYYSRYFPRYTRPWISDADFDADIHNSMTGDDARLIDAAIDQYNWAIKQRVHDERLRGSDWYVVDLCGLLDRVAYRRYLASAQSRPDWWTDFGEADVLPPELLAMSPRPDTRFFASDKKGRTQGGLIALDGVHPTTIGYGLIAREVLEVMKLAAVPGAAEASIDFGTLLAEDTLNSDPPAQISEDGRMIGMLNRAVDVVEVLFGMKPT